jgi:hypothetical protein
MFYKNPYEYSKVIEQDDKILKKSKILHGEFIPASKKPLRG